MTAVDHINLVIPGIFNFPTDEVDAESLARNLPAFHEILRFGAYQAGHRQCFDQLLGDLLRYDQCGGLPYAGALNPQGPASQCLFKPVFVKADLNNAFVYPLEKTEDLNFIINDLCDFFKKDFNVEALPDGTSILVFRKLKRLPNNPHYLCVVGQSAAALQDRSADLSEWNLLLNEIQMFLYQHPRNQQRTQNGQPFFNSLWIWGHGQKDPLDRSATEWISADPGMQRLGEYLGCAKGSRSHPPETRVIVDLSLIQALKGDSSEPIVELLHHIETQVLSPQIRRFRKSLTLFDGQGGSIALRPYDRWKFWKRPRLSTTALE